MWIPKVNIGVTVLKLCVSSVFIRIPCKKNMGISSLVPRPPSAEKLDVIAKQNHMVHVWLDKGEPATDLIRVVNTIHNKRRRG